MKSVKYALLLPPLALLFLLPAWPNPVPASPVAEADPARRLDAFVVSCHEAGIFNGCALVAAQGKIVFQKALGYADIFERTPLTIETKFDIGSLSKSFTAMAILIQQERGKLRLEDPLSQYFPDFPEYAGRITLYHLLSHQSGIQDFHNDLAMMDEALEDKTVLERLRKENLLFEPGSKACYSNSGFFLLARIIEMTSGHSFREFLRENIFRPLGMAQADVQDHTHRNIPGKAAGLNWTAPAEIGSWITGPSGVLISARDLFLWHRALMDAGLIPQAALERAIRPAVLANGEKTRFGLGWEISEHNGETFIGHGGATPAGYMAYFLQPRSGRYAIILLTNYYYPANFERVIAGVRAIMEGREPANEKTPAVFRLHRHWLENGHRKLGAEYQRLKSEESTYRPMDEIDFVQLERFYRNRRKIEPAIAVLELYRREYPASVFMYDELVAGYRAAGRGGDLAKAEAAGKALREKKSAEPPIEILLTNPNTEDSQFTLNVRKGPGSEYETGYGITPGESYTVVGKSPNGEWLKLKKGGWIFNRIGRLTQAQWASLPIRGEEEK